MFFGEDSKDKIISQVVTTAINTLFKQTQKLEARVEAQPWVKLLQGSIDSFDLIGDRCLMYNGLCIEHMQLSFQAVSIDFGGIFQGQVKLRHPIEGTMRAIFTENDLTTGFNTSFINRQLKKINDENTHLDFKNIKLLINDDRSLNIKISVIDEQKNVEVDLAFNTHLDLEERKKIQFVNVSYPETQPAQKLTKVIINHVNKLLDLDIIALDGTQLRVDSVNIIDRKIIFDGVTSIYRFPEKRNL